MTQRPCALFAAALGVCMACQDSPRDDAREADPVDAAALEDAAFPPLFDAAGREPFEPPPFEAGAPVPDNPAFNPLSRLDAGARPDALTPSPIEDCLEVEPGEVLRFEDQLTDEHTWLRIEAVEQCPAMVVTAKRVAYQPYTLCPSHSTRLLDVVMRGSDRLDMPPRQSVADTFLAIYARESDAIDDPFACLGSSDNGIFDGLVANSARLEGLEVAADTSVVILASSAERPDQRGIGLFELEITVR